VAEDGISPRQVVTLECGIKFMCRVEPPSYLPSVDRQASNKNAKLADEAIQQNAMESTLRDNTTKVVKR
jgi:hypothetical protein